MIAAAGKPGPGRQKRGVILLSGGLDSVTMLALARRRAFDLWALSFRYDQRHAVELECAGRQARHFGVVAHEIIELHGFDRLIGSATSLIRSSPLGVPKRSDGTPSSTGGGSAIPSTYVPARNTIFFAYALAWAEALDAGGLWSGVNAVDYSGYPDCRPAYVDAFARLANLATRDGVDAVARGETTPAIEVHTPLIGLTKHEIIRLGTDLGVNYADTVSCYDPTQGADKVVLACGRCESCGLRRAGFERANVADPTLYVPTGNL